MPTERTCPRCGTALSSDALEGLCPTCVGRAAFADVPTVKEAHDSIEPPLSPEIEAELARLKPEEVGDQIGPYKLMEQIGEGGFGAVWVADQERPVRRRVALKIIKLGMDTKEVIGRFEQERQALALMDHPNIAKVFDAGATQWGRPFFVMELVRGIRITDYCDQAKLPTADRLRLFIQVCHAVQHAHQKGIIHRDIKPSNILVAMHEGVAVPKVIDFGIAKATAGRLADATVYTQLNQFIGTPAYMSPEQAEMNSLDIDTRSDLYSLGVLLYELLVGKTPFDQETLMRAGLDEMRRVIREQEPPKPSTALQTMEVDVRTTVAQRRQADGAKMAGQLRGDLDWIVMKALEKDRTRRYETANGFAEDIRRYLANEPVTAAAPSMAYLFGKFARRNRTALAVAALIAVVLVVATGISVWQAGLARKAASDAADARNDATAKAADERAAREDAEAITSFLFDMFESPDPAREGHTVTVAETLDSAVKKIDADLSTQGWKRARLQFAIGRTYHALDLAPKAIPLLEAVRDYCLPTLGAEHPATMAAMRELSFSYVRAGRQTDATKLQEELVKLCRTIHAPDHPERMAALQNLANSYANTGRLSEALKLYEELEPVSATANEKNRRDMVALISNLASLWNDAGQQEDALRLRVKALNMSRDVSGRKHPDTLLAMNNLTQSYLALGNADKALELQTETVELSVDVNGPTHTETLTAMSNLATAYGRSGNLDKALEIHQKVLNVRSATYGDDHPDTLVAMTNLAVSYAKGNRLREGIELEEKALATMRRVLPKRDPYLIGALQIMSGLYWQDGQREKAHALRLEREALEGKSPVPDEPPSPAVKATPPVAATPSPTKPTAVKPLEDALEKLRETKDPKPAEMIAAMTELARAYGADGSAGNAIKLGEEALGLARGSLPKGDAHTVALMNLLIPLYKAVDSDADARKVEAELQSLTTEKQK